MQSNRVRDLLRCGVWAGLAWIMLFVGFQATTRAAEDAGPKLLEFCADWCGACREMEPTVEALSAAGWRVERIDVDRRKSLAVQYGVQRIPCFVAVENGVETDRVVGIADYERLSRMLVRRERPKTVEKRSLQPTPAWRYEQAEGHRAAVVRIFAEDGAAHRSIGSGVLVRWNGRVVVLTARHVVKDARKIVVELCTKRSHSATIIKVDAVWDCAVLELDGAPQGVVPAELELGDAAMQQEGNRLESCGYGPDGRLACNSGVFLGYRRTTQSPQGPDDWLVISGHARGGDSGGPVFNDRGRVIGILWGTDGREVVGVQAGRVHQLLDAAVPLHQPRSIELVSWQRAPTPAKKPADPPCCDGGSCSIARQESIGQIVGRKPIPAPAAPQVIVQPDLDVRRSLGSIDAKLGAMVEQKQPKPSEEKTADEASPLVAGLCILAAAAAGVAIYFGTQKQ